MPVLKLSIGESILKEIQIGTEPITIGRSPQSEIFIDNPAVSFRHAKIFAEGGIYYVQDMSSLNGTFLNGLRITQAPLSHGDVVTVGKHAVRFSIDRPGVAAPAAPVHQQPRMNETQLKLSGTMILDTKMRRELQDRLAKGEGAAPESRVAHVGKLIVVKGKTKEKEYVLSSQTTLVGKADGCAVRLKGWFAPKVGATLTKKDETYFLSPAVKKVTVNGQPVLAKTELKEGDLVGVGSVLMQFTLVTW